MRRLNVQNNLLTSIQPRIITKLEELWINDNSINSIGALTAMTELDHTYHV